MAILPGWNSLAAAGSIAHSLHIAAMIVLAVLVAAEGMALGYDRRKYALIGAAERDVTARMTTNGEKPGRVTTTTSRNSSEGLKRHSVSKPHEG